MLISRELGEIPVTISTAIAISSFTGNSDLYNDRDLWINVRTLYRNIVSSIDSEIDYDNESLLTDLMEEHKIISSVLEDFYQGYEGKFYFYVNTFESIEKFIPDGKIKENKTENQISYVKSESEVLTAFAELIGEDILIFDTKLDGSDRKGMVFTHFPVELLSRYTFSDLLLLESHTGAIKSQTLWNTKLTGGKKNYRLPFNYFTLVVYGDNSNLLKSYPIGVKKLIDDISEHSGWSAATSEEKIVKDMAEGFSGNEKISEILSPVLGKKFFF